MIIITLTIEDKGNRIIINGQAIGRGATQSEFDESKDMLYIPASEMDRLKDFLRLLPLKEKT